jgi:hypothetical protein
MGRKNGKERLNVLKKWNIDFPLFLKHQIEKGQNTLISVGKLLRMTNMFETLVQCKCGEVIGLVSEILKVMKEMYPDGICCSKCDPEQLKRLRKMGYPLVKFDHSALIGYILRSSEEKV